MINKQSHLKFAILLVLALLQAGTCLICFQCGEPVVSNRVCRDENGNVNATRVCTESQVCVSHWVSAMHIGQLETPEILIRVCGHANYCDVHSKLVERTLSVTTKGCETCSTDHCNLEPFSDL